MTQQSINIITPQELMQKSEKEKENYFKKRLEWINQEGSSPIIFELFVNCYEELLQNNGVINKNVINFIEVMMFRQKNEELIFLINKFLTNNDLIQKNKDAIKEILRNVNNNYRIKENFLNKIIAKVDAKESFLMSLLDEKDYEKLRKDYDLCIPVILKEYRNHDPIFKNVFNLENNDLQNELLMIIVKKRLTSEKFYNYMIENKKMTKDVIKLIFLYESSKEILTKFENEILGIKDEILKPGRHGVINIGTKSIIFKYDKFIVGNNFENYFIYLMINKTSQSNKITLSNFLSELFEYEKINNKLNSDAYALIVNRGIMQGARDVVVKFLNHLEVVNPKEYEKIKKALFTFEKNIEIKLTDKKAIIINFGNGVFKKFNDEYFKYLLDKNLPVNNEIKKANKI